MTGGRYHLAVEEEGAESVILEHLDLEVVHARRCQEATQRCSGFPTLPQVSGGCD